MKYSCVRVDAMSIYSVKNNASSNKKSRPRMHLNGSLGVEIQPPYTIYVTEEERKEYDDNPWTKEDVTAQRHYFRSKDLLITQNLDWT